jgi:hypothetical protein
MFDKAKVTTSKFLQLKERLAKELACNKTLYAPGAGNGFRDYTKEADNRSLLNAFNELCDLLHELVSEA